MTTYGIRVTFDVFGFEFRMIAGESELRIFSRKDTAGKGSVHKILFFTFSPLSIVNPCCIILIERLASCIASFLYERRETSRPILKERVSLVQKA
jgi:hypothetical protein